MGKNKIAVYLGIIIILTLSLLISYFSFLTGKNYALKEEYLTRNAFGDLHEQLVMSHLYLEFLYSGKYTELAEMFNKNMDASILYMSSFIEGGKSKDSKQNEIIEFIVKTVKKIKEQREKHPVKYENKHIDDLIDVMLIHPDE